MKLEFNKFDVDSFDKSKNWEADCVFILKDGTFMEGLIRCRNGEIYYHMVDVINDDLIFQEFAPEFYMFKD